MQEKEKYVLHLMLKQRADILGLESYTVTKSVLRKGLNKKY